MNRQTLCSLFFVLTLSLPGALGQDFDAATVKPSVDPQLGMIVGARGGPGTDTPGRYVCRHCPLRMVLESAYGVDHGQIVAPGWTDSQYLDIAGNVPVGTSRAEFRTML